MAEWKKILTEDSSGDVSISGDITVSGGDISNAPSTNFKITSGLSFTVDAANDIILDAAGNDIWLKTSDVTFGRFTKGAILLYSEDDTDDYLSLSTDSNHGSATISTNDDSGASGGDLTIDPDGKLIITSSTIDLNASGDVNISGDLQVSGNNITGSDGTALIEFSGNDLKLSDDLYMNSDYAGIIFNASNSFGQDAVTDAMYINKTGDHTNLPEYTLTLRSLTTETPAIGFGAGLKFISNAGPGMSQLNDIGELLFTYTNIGDGTEDSKLEIKLMNEGSQSTVLTIEDDGDLDITGYLKLPGSGYFMGAGSSVNLMAVDRFTLTSIGGSDQDCAIDLIPSAGYDSQINFKESVSAMWTIGNDGSDNTNHKFHFSWQDTDVGDDSMFSISSNGMLHMKHDALLANGTVDYGGTGDFTAGSGTLIVQALANGTGHLVARHMTSSFGTNGYLILSDNEIEVTTSDLYLKTAANISLNPTGGIVNIKNNGSSMADITGDATRTSLYLYEKGGDSTEDYFRIIVGEHGATTMSTRDAVAQAADLIISPDGGFTVDAFRDIELNADGGNVIIKDDTYLHGEWDMAAKEFKNYYSDSYSYIKQMTNRGATVIGTDDDSGSDSGHLSLRPMGKLLLRGDVGGTYLMEKASAGANETGYGQLYAKDDQTLHYVFDDGTDKTLQYTGGGGGGGATKTWMDWYNYGCNLASQNTFYSEKHNDEWGVSNSINTNLSASGYSTTTLNYGWRMIRYSRRVPYSGDLTKFMVHLESSGAAADSEVEVALWWADALADDTEHASTANFTCAHLATLTFDFSIASRFMTKQTTSFNADSISEGDWLFITLRKTTSGDGSSFHCHSTVLWDIS
jgi:hypothetical protein